MSEPTDTLTLYPQGAGRDCKDAEASTLTLYTRVGCPLCEDMAVALGSLLEGTGHAVVSIDVDTDPALKAAYGWDVPVLFAGEIELCRHELNLTVLRDWLRARA